MTPFLILLAGFGIGFVIGAAAAVKTARLWFADDAGPGWDGSDL